MGPSQLRDLQDFPFLPRVKTKSWTRSELSTWHLSAAFVAVDSLRKCLQGDCGDQGPGASHFTDY